MLRNRPGSIIKRLIKVNIGPAGTQTGNYRTGFPVHGLAKISKTMVHAVKPFDFAHDNPFFQNEFISRFYYLLLVLKYLPRTIEISPTEL